jgi:hypothetical protein
LDLSWAKMADDGRMYNPFTKATKMKKILVLTLLTLGSYAYAEGEFNVRNVTRDLFGLRCDSVIGNHRLNLLTGARTKRTNILNLKARFTDEKGSGTYKINSAISYNELDEANKVHSQMTVNAQRNDGTLLLINISLDDGDSEIFIQGKQQDYLKISCETNLAG